MTTRKILLIDNDSTFGAEFRSALQGLDCELFQSDETLVSLGQVTKMEPDIIIIAAELPKKMGYAICNKIRKTVAPQTPIILTTSSLPTESFNQHSKLKYRADDYFDKRLASAADLVGAVDSVLHLEQSLDESAEFEIEDFSDVTKSESVFEDEATQYVMDNGNTELHDQFESANEYELANDSLENQTVDDISNKHTKQSLVAPSKPNIESQPSLQDNDSIELSKKNQDLEQEISSLKSQLLAAQDAAQQPAGDTLEKDRELLALREKLNQKEKSILDLKEQIDAKDKDILDAKEKLRNTERNQSNSDSLLLNKDQEVLSLKEEIASWMVKEKSLSEQITEISAAKDNELREQEQKRVALNQEHEESLASVKSEHQKFIGSLTKEHDSEIKKLQEQFEEEKSTAAQSANDMQASAISKALEDERSTLATKHEQSLASLKSELEADFSKKEQEITTQLAQQASEHKQALVDLQDKQHGQLNRLERESKEAIDNIKNEKDAELQSLATEWETKLNTQLKLNEENQKTFAENEASILLENEQSAIAWQIQADEINIDLASKVDRIEELQATLAESNQALAQKNEAIENHAQSLSLKASELQSKQAQIDELENRILATESRLADARNDLASHRDTNEKAKKAMAIALTLIDMNDMDVGSQPIGTHPGEEEAVDTSDVSKLS